MDRPKEDEKHKKKFEEIWDERAEYNKRERQRDYLRFKILDKIEAELKRDDKDQMPSGLLRAKDFSEIYKNLRDD